MKTKFEKPRVLRLAEEDLECERCEPVSQFSQHGGIDSVPPYHPAYASSIGSNFLN